MAQPPRPAPPPPDSPSPGAGPARDHWPDAGANPASWPPPASSTSPLPNLPPPPPAGAGPAGGDAPAVPGARHLTLADLPPALAERLSFDRAAPRRLRSERVPEPVRADLQELWDGLIADVYDEVTGLKRTRSLRRETVERVLARVSVRLLQAQRSVIVTAVHYPMRADEPWKHVAAAGVGGGAAAAAESVAAYGTAGAAATIALVSAMVGEVFETYIAASARTRQYQGAARSPDPTMVVTDLAEAAGYGGSIGRRASNQLAHDAAKWLGDRLLTRTASRFARGLIPVIGVGVGAGMSAFNVNKVVKIPLRPVSEQEVWRLAHGVMTDEEYRTERERFLAVTGADGPEGDQPTP